TAVADQVNPSSELPRGGARRRTPGGRRGTVYVHQLAVGRTVHWLRKDRVSGASAQPSAAPRSSCALSLVASYTALPARFPPPKRGGCRAMPAVPLLLKYTGRRSRALRPVQNAFENVTDPATARPRTRTSSAVPNRERPGPGLDPCVGSRVPEPQRGGRGGGTTGRC